MKRTINFIVYGFLLALVLASCSKKASVPVPKDAAIVIHIDGASLNSKLSWDEIKQSEWFKITSTKTEDELSKKLLDNPEASGVDIKSDAYIFVQLRGRGAYTAFSCGIKDEKAFADFMSKVTEGGTPKKSGDLTYISKPGTVLTWNGKRFLLIADTPDANSSSSMMMGKRNTGTDNHFPEDSLVKFAENIFDLKSSNSIGSNSKFESMMKEEGDAHFWVNAGSLYGNALPAMLAITKASLLFDGNISAATLNFENGKITLKGKSYHNKDLTALFKKYSMKNLDEDMLKKIPAGKTAAALAFNYPPEGLKEFIAVLGVDGLLNMFLAEAGFSVEDFVRANKGDVLLSVADFTYAEKQQQGNVGNDEPMFYKATRPDGKFLFATSVNDRPSFEKLMNILQQKIGSPEDAAFAAKMIPHQLTDKWFIAGNDSVTVNAFGKSNIDHPFIRRISGHPMGGFIDLQQFISGSQPMYREDTAAMRAADHALKTWQDIIFYGGEIKDDALVSYVEVNMVDKTTNSLKQLNNFLGNMGLIIQEENAKRELIPPSVLVDSTTAKPKK